MLLVSEHSTKHSDKKIIYQSPSIRKEFEVIQEKEFIGKGTYSTVLASCLSAPHKLELFGKGTLIEKIPSLDWPVGKTVVLSYFLFDDRQGRAQISVSAVTWTSGP